MHDLQNKVVVITGASSGFGKGAALQFAKAGAHLVLAARREYLLDELVRECEASGGWALSVPTDVSQQAEVEHLAKTAVKEFDAIDVWVNNAGVAALGRCEDIPLADHVKVIETNLLGTIYGSYFALQQFRQQQSGTLINIASALGKVPAPYYASYAASKYGIVGLSAALRQELAEDGVENVNVCTVMPMAMDTYFFDHASNYTGRESVPIPPLSDPQMVVDTIVRLAAKPEDEVMVGGESSVMGALHSLMPSVVEIIMGKEVYSEQIEMAPASEPFPGSLHKPMAAGTEVSAGRLNA